MDFAGEIKIEKMAPVDVAVAPPKRQNKHHLPVKNCQNCGTKLVGNHCHACCQHGHVHRSVSHVVKEVLQGIAHLDSRAWRSLPMLAFRPGTLTRNYVMEQRARYVPPFAMLLSLISAMFLVFSFSGRHGLAFAMAAVIMPVHIFFQLKGAYQLKWFSASWRTTLFCGVFSWVVISLFFVSIIALGVTG